MAVYDRVLTTDPEDVGTLYHKGIALGNLGRYDEAVVGLTPD